MKRKWIKMLAAAMCVMMAVPLIGSAAPLDLAATCSLTVEPIEPAAGINDETVADLATVNLVYDLYKVADMVDDGGYYTYKIASDDVFKALLSDDKLQRYIETVNGEHRLIVPRDGSDANSGLWEDLSQAAAKIALDPTEADDSTAVPGNAMPVVGEFVGTMKKGEKGLNPVTDNTALPTGLYLLIARGGEAGDYYITTVKTQEDKKDGAGTTDSTTETTEEIVTVAYSDQYVYSFKPQLISLPTKTPDTNGVISTASNGEWQYNPTIYLKPGQKRRYGYLEIVKELLTYESFAGQSEEAVFVFQVEATLNGNSVYSDVKTMTFTGAGEQRILIDKIPVGAAVTVTEVYSGASYELKSVNYGYYTAPRPASDTQIYTNAVTGLAIEANRVASVKFTNDYDHRQTGGHGVVNTYEYTETGWATNGAQQEYTDASQNNPPQGN